MNARKLLSAALVLLTISSISHAALTQNRITKVEVIGNEAPIVISFDAHLMHTFEGQAAIRQDVEAAARSLCLSVVISDTGTEKVACEYKDALAVSLDLK